MKQGGVYIDGDGNQYAVNPDGSLTPSGKTANGNGANLSDLATRAAGDAGLRYTQDAVKGAFGSGGSEAAVSAGGPGLGEIGYGGGNYTPVPPGFGAPAPTPSAFSLGGIGTAGNVILPAAGAAGLYDLSQNRKRIGTGSGYLEGAASGAALGSYFGPVGAGVGAGLGLLGNAFGIGHQSRTKGEEQERSALADQGVVVPNSDVKEWELNQKFHDSRNEADLTGKDIVHAGDFYSQISGYAGLDPAKQEAIANEALKEKLIQEKLGKIDLGTSSQFAAFVNQQMGAPTGAGGPSVRAVQQDAADRKKQRAAALIPSLIPQTNLAPRYDQNPGSLIKNPYL